jgi:exodeoxyribonuclease VII small subunit
MGKTKLPSFEANYQRLEEVIALLDSGNLPLAETVTLYEEGIKLAQVCEQLLDNAEIQVTQLLAGTESPLPNTEH